MKYVEAFIEQLENPTMMSDEQKVIKDAQDTFRSYDELKALREISVYWVQKRSASTSMRSSPERKVSQTSVTSPPSPVSTPGAVEDVTSPTLQRWFPLWGGWYNSENVHLMVDIGVDLSN